MELMEKTLTSKLVYDGGLLKVHYDTVELINGRTSWREVIRHPGAVVMVPIDDEDNIYLVRQYRYALGQELWELPAGKLEKGEDPFEAAKRELAEECGLVAEHYTDLGEFYPTVGYCSEIIYTWLATGLSPCAMHLDEDEFLTPEKLPFAEAVAMVLDGRIKDGKTVAAILKIDALRRQGKLTL